jgi:hypothetical protein
MLGNAGANVGLFSLQASQAVKAKGRVVAIEALPPTFACLSRNLGSMAETDRASTQWHPSALHMRRPLHVHQVCQRARVAMRGYFMSRQKKRGMQPGTGGTEGVPRHPCRERHTSLYRCCCCFAISHVYNVSVSFRHAVGLDRPAVQRPSGCVTVLVTIGMVLIALTS